MSIENKNLPKTRFNDALIVELCKDLNYKINQDGTIDVLKTLCGKPSKTWRKAYFSKVKNKYLKLRYQNKNLCVHRIVFYKFSGFLDSKLDINHIDGNTFNNSYDNLELVSRSENLKHSYRVLNRKVSLEQAWEARGLFHV